MIVIRLIMFNMALVKHSLTVILEIIARINTVVYIGGLVLETGDGILSCFGNRT